jgi:methionyl-tRNA formyltransferase
MRILFLGYAESQVIDFLLTEGNEVYRIGPDEKITLEKISGIAPDFIVSYGYRKIIGADIVRTFPNIINLHISMLPWNRGADPNFWSFVEDTPKGVTIHYLDEWIDRGDIIAQREVSFPRDATLRTSYNGLRLEVEQLFRETWPAICAGTCNRKKQEGRGSRHAKGDIEQFSHLLSDGWDTPIMVLDEYAAETQMSIQARDNEIIEISRMK